MYTLYGHVHVHGRTITIQSVTPIFLIYLCHFNGTSIDAAQYSVNYIGYSMVFIPKQLCS